MNHTKYLALLAGCSFVAACENPVDGDLNVDNPDAYTLVYTVNAVENDSKSTLTFPLERDTVFSVYANLSCIRDPGSDITAEFPTAPALAEGYYTAAAMQALKARYGVDLPICDAVYRVLYEGADAKGEIDGLFRRSLKREIDGKCCREV